MSTYVKPRNRKKPLLGRGLVTAQRVRVSVVIAALNEAQNLPYVLPRIPAWVDEVVLVDGRSTDGTADVARSLYPSVRVLVQKGEGKGDALRAGFAAARGDIIVALDADGSTDPTEMPAFVGALLAGADFAKGSRFMQGAYTTDMPVYRQIGNHCFVLLVRLLFGHRYSDLCYGYNAFWRHALQSLQLDSDGFEIETIMNVRALKTGLKVVEVASFEAPRVHGKGRLRTIPDGWRVLKAIWREWRSAQQSASSERSIQRRPLSIFDGRMLTISPSRGNRGAEVVSTISAHENRSSLSGIYSDQPLVTAEARLAIDG